MEGGQKIAFPGLLGADQQDDGCRCIIHHMAFTGFSWSRGDWV